MANERRLIDATEAEKWAREHILDSNHYCSHGEPWSNINQLPDESITNDEMRSYGYTWGGMIPMREKAAMEVIKFCTVYRLYADYTESMVLNESEINAHAVKGGIFGVQRADWEAAGKC